MTVAEAAGQPERTRLAWRRTALTATVVFLLMVRYAVSGGATPQRIAVLVLALPAYLTLLAAAQRRVAAMSAMSARQAEPGERAAPIGGSGGSGRIPARGSGGAGRMPVAAAGAAVGYAVLGMAMVVVRGG